MVTSRDVQEIVSKLSSDKAKARDEGIKLLNTWLEGERSIAFCKFLGQNTANLRPDEIPHSETWPFLVTLLIQCTSLEISSSKRRLPKLIYAKTLRIVVQRAEDAKFSGKMLPLLSAVKLLSNHIWDVLSNVPIFQSEYGVILRHLLAVRDYRFHMRKRIYCMETSLGEKIDGQYNPKEEVFRCILTLQSLLENPPGDFPHTFRDDIIKGFVGIFSYIRDEGKISRKLIECVNTFLLKDGPNLGSQSLEIHNSVQQFVFRCWLTTHDRALKACIGTAKAPSTQKRLKREHASAHLKEALMKGKWLWNAAFCYLTHNYNNRISKDLLVYWFKGICSNFERILNDANMGHDYDGLLWTLRSLQELSSVPLLPYSKGEISSISSSTLSEVDAALVLLGNIISYDLINTYIIPQDIWDLRLFKRMPSVSVLYFISCYFSRKGSQGDIRDILNLRKSLLRVVLGHVNWKEPSILNDRVVLFLPAAVYAICAGCAPFKQCYNGFPLSYSFVDDTEATLEQVKTEDFEHDSLHEVFECSVEVLARIDQDCGVEVSPLQSHQGVRLPRQLRDQLLQEMETYILGSLVDKEIEKSPISDIFFRCFVNFFRKSEEVSPFLSEMGKCLLELLHHAHSVIQGNYTNFRSLSCLGSDSIFGGTNTLVASLRSFICCPIFMKWRDQDDLDVFLYGSVMQSMEKLLHALVKLYEEYSECVRNFRSENILQDLSVSDNSVQNSFASDGNKSRIMDMELDVNEDSRDVDILTVGVKIATGISFSSEKWKFSIISVISSFFSVLPIVTWDILFELMGKESDQKVCEKILYNLCQHPYWSSSTKITDLVNLFNDMIEMQRLTRLGDLVNKVADLDLLDWFGRVKLIDCTCDFVLLCPQIGQAVFMMCAVAAIDPCQRELVNAVIHNLSRQLKYTSMLKYLEELMGSIIFCWVACGVSLVALVEIRQLFVSDAEPSYFIQYCCHWLLPALVLHGDISNLSWVAKVACHPLAVLVKNHFVPIFAICMALHCSKKSGWEKGAVVLQSSILRLAEISESERDKLIKKHMVSIVSHILSLASCASDPPVPLFSKDAIVHAVQTVVDGFLEMEDNPITAGVVDKINIFRPDRVFMFIVEMHYKIAAAVHHRHKCHRLAGIEVLINILGHRAAVSSTSNYLFNLIGQFISSHALQDQCCGIISALLRTFKSNPSEEMISVLGEQLQFLVSKLVACCIPSEANGEDSGTILSQVLSLLLQLTVDSDPAFYDYIRELEPFPEIDIFDKIRKFHQELCRAYSPRDHLLKFVKRSSYLPPRLLLWSLQALHKKLLMGETCQSGKNSEDLVTDRYWNGDNEIVHAVWTLVRMCGSDDADSVRALASDFISRVGIGDPHCVVFHLPGYSSHIHVCQPINHDTATEINFHMVTGISDELLMAILKLLKKYLMDDSVKIIDMTSQALRVHSKGINIDLVEKFLLDLERKFKAEAILLEKSTVWVTQGKTFEMWICPLVYALIGYCNDVILRLCQEIVLLKAEVAELLLPSVIVNLAGRKDLEAGLHKTISLQLQEHIFTESNKLIKSIQVFLNALNELRLCHVMESSSLPSKRESSKSAKPSSYSSKSRSTTVKAKDLVATSSAVEMATSLWDKVYWLCIDYLHVAKSAVICGSYFTSMMYVEYWCEEHFNSLILGSPDFSHNEMILIIPVFFVFMGLLDHQLPLHVEILVSAVTQINEPDSLYGIIQSHKHEGNWSKALEYYDLQVRSDASLQMDDSSRYLSSEETQPTNHLSVSKLEDEMTHRKPYKGLIRSLQQIGCMHVLDLYCQGLTSRKGQFQHDLEFAELQYEAAWRAGNWDFSLLDVGANSPSSSRHIRSDHFNENLHSCLRALQEGDFDEFHRKLKDSKQELVLSVSRASEESTEYIYSTIIKLQIFYHLGMSWDLRWTTSSCERIKFFLEKQKVFSEPVIPTTNQLSWLNTDWKSILERSQLHMNLLEPFIAFRRVLLQILSCKNSKMQHLLQSASTLRKGSRFSQAAAALHEFKFLCLEATEQYSTLYWLGRLEEAKLLRAQGQDEIAISLAKYIIQNYELNEEASDVYRLVGKWLAETRASNSRTILEKYLKPAVSLAADQNTTNKKSIERQSQTHFHLAHYADALFRSYEERLTSNEWQAAMRLRKHKGEKIDYSGKIQELQKQVAMDGEEAEKLQDDRDNFLSLALEGYQRCLVIGDKYDVRVVQSYKFIPLAYQIASRMGSSKDTSGPHNFQFALVSLVKKMAIDHPYHTIFQLLALANGDRIKDKQRSRNSFVDTNKRIALPREIRSLRQLELVPVVTATFPVDRSCQYHEGSFPYFKGLVDSVMVMNGINAPKVVECLGSDGRRYRQLAKSGNDDLRQDAVMEQFFGLVNTFLQNHRDTWKRRLGVRTYKVVPFTPSAGVLEWVDGTLPLGEYLIGSTRNGGAHGRYGLGDWSFLRCREHMANEKDKRKAFHAVSENFRPVMHYFFLERFLQPADWFEKRLAYTRSVAASSMVGYIVGLGDRHSMNILIDQATAEVVHIDLGVAFEQGLMLKTPERVPFRLTRDIIDGMGVTGVEGVFRRCCEETLSVMRANKEALLTIVEVFIHDPLYKWALSPLKALQRQKETDDDIETILEDSQDECEGNKDATRALIRVKQKLDGYEEGEMRSVRGQVQQLIQDAIDPERLCHMFPGWGAWL
ncbi:serine/threonine-protein kinase atm [Quercus suber]|uniref:Serine/threonine-protein kinase ATM n=1 Tax=Quercus suber TaxID=58331 RepID=A0AAW0LN92_QUESU